MSRPSDLETAMSNMNALVALAVDLLIENMDCPQHGKHHLLPAAQSNQIVSLLVAARDYGEFQFKNREEVGA